jgi:hypothetical protein
LYEYRPTGDRRDDGRHGEHRPRVVTPEEEKQSDQQRERHTDPRPVLAAERAER